MRLPLSFHTVWLLRAIPRTLVARRGVLRRIAGDYARWSEEAAGGAREELAMTAGLPGCG